MTPKLLTERDASEFLGIAPATLRRWRVTGAGPTFVKVGRAVRYRQEVLTAYVDANAMASTSAKSEG